jgi:LuxR family quorum-sensing system transcriptional regulator CciR
LCETTRHLGCDYYALTHHVDWRRGPPGAIRLHNYPARWVEFFDHTGLGGVDPVQRASEQTGFGFSWNDLARLIPLTANDRHVLALARAHGIGDGFTVPFNLPGEFLGSCSFAPRAGCPMPMRSLILAQLVGAYAFEAARRLLGMPRLLTCPSPLLTIRQHDCTVLVAGGKSNWEIGRILGISANTVRQHVSESCGRLGVHDRTSLIVRALRSGTISFSEVAI